MELLFQIIIILAFIKYCMKAGFFVHWGGMAAYALFVAVVAIAFYPFIIKTDSNVFERLLADKNGISDFAVLITIEAISGMLISVGMLGNLFSQKKQKWIKVLKLTPGVLIAGAVFYVELALFRSFAGMDFAWVAVICAVSLLMGTFLLSFLIKFLLPDYSTRYELKFLTNLILLLLSIFLNAGLADYNSSNYQANPEFTKLGVFAAIAAAGFIFGFILFKNRNILRKRK
jgi:hypothetical protein